MKTPYIAYPPPPILFQILSNTLSSTFLSPPTSTQTVLSVVLFLWLNGWSCHSWCAILLNNNMDLHMSSHGTLVPEGPWCVFYATRCQAYWGLTYNVVFYWYCVLISQTPKLQQHTQTSGLTHLYKCIFTPLVMCSKELPLLY